MNKAVDVLIIGGGLTGATLVLALRGLGLRTLMVETNARTRQPTGLAFDARTLALSPASQRILNTLGVWPSLADHATPIQKIHVSNQHGFGVSRLRASPANALGYVLEMQDLQHALYSLLPPEVLLAPAQVMALDVASQTATVRTEQGDVPVTAKLIVAADGADSLVRQWCGLPATTKHYQQLALVANVALANPHGFCAFERFTAHGPLALLPMQGNRMALVWTLPCAEAKALSACDAPDFLKALHLAFGYRLGRLTHVGERYTYPLKQVITTQTARNGVVLVGNAAQSLHPVAGQGFNLGLRDVATLAQCIAKHGVHQGMVTEYARLRSVDRRVIAQLTDGLVSLFTSQLPGMGLMRNVGLLAFDHLPVLKNLLRRYAAGFGGTVPDLVCEIALTPREFV